MIRWIPIIAAGAIALLTLSGCAGYVKQAHTMQQQVHADKMATEGELLDLACDVLLVNDVRDAIVARPEMNVGLPIICPGSVGALKALICQVPANPTVLRNEMAEPDAAAPAQ